MKKLILLLLFGLMLGIIGCGGGHGDQPAEIRDPDGCTETQVIEWVQNSS